MNTKHLKAKILDLAIRGKLVPQDSSEGNAAELLQKIREEKFELVKQKKIKEDKNASFIIKADDGKHYEQFTDGSLKDIEDEIPFEIPENWCWCRLPSLCTIPITDGTHQTPTYSDKENGVPFLSSKDVTKQVIDWSNIKYITRDLHEELYKRIAPQRDDVLLAKNGTTGVAALVEDDKVFDIYVTLAVLRADQRILLPRFLLWTINSPVCKEQFNSHLLGIGVPNLHLYEINKTLIPLPPLEEQKRIISAIEKINPQIDIIEKNKLNLKTYIKQTKSKVLDLAIHGKLVEQNPQEGNAFELLEKIRNEKAELIKQKKLKEDKNASFIKKADNGKHYEQFTDGRLKDVEEEIPFEIPENWCWCRLPELCFKISDGTHKTPTYVDSGIPFLSVQNISKGYFDLNVIKYITPEEHNKLCQRIKPQKDDILICRIGTLGRAIRNILDFEFSIFVSLGLIRLMNTDFVDYVIATLNSNYGTGWIDDNKVQGSHTNKINLETFPKLFIPLPPAEEQKRIIRRVEQVFEQLDILEKSMGE